jgi:hypothetical protein
MQCRFSGEVTKWNYVHYLEKSSIGQFTEISVKALGLESASPQSSQFQQTENINITAMRIGCTIRIRLLQACIQDGANVTNRWLTSALINACWNGSQQLLPLRVRAHKQLFPSIPVLFGICNSAAMLTKQAWIFVLVILSSWFSIRLLYESSVLTR